MPSSELTVPGWQVTTDTYVLVLANQAGRESADAAHNMLSDMAMYLYHHKTI